MMGMSSGFRGLHFRVGARPVLAGMLLLVGILVAACSGGSGSVATVPGPAEAPEGVPLPPGAALIAGTSGDFLIQGSTYLDMLVFYETELRAGNPLGDWAWCSLLVQEGTVYRRYNRTGTNDILSVLIVRGSPPRVEVSVDQSGPC